MPYRTEDGLFEIGIMTEEAVRPILNVLCLRCGVRVVHNPKEMDIHKTFHEEIDELVDWARSVSNLFKRPEPDASEDKRRISSGHAEQHETSIKDRFDTGSSEEGLQKGSE